MAITNVFARVAIGLLALAVGACGGGGSSGGSAGNSSPIGDTGSGGGSGGGGSGSGGGDPAEDGDDGGQGGGGGEDLDEPDEEAGSTLTGRLIGPAASGIQYLTPTHSGVTASDGSFKYEPGERVAFRIGDVLLGVVAGKTAITLFDLADVEALIGNREADAVVDFDPLEYHHDILHPRPVPDFHKAINLAVLLQTLDRDADPTNGIEITEQIASLFDGVEIDIERDYLAFTTDVGLRTALNQANSASLLSEHRAVIPPGVALDNVYASLAIDARLFVVATAETRDADGTLRSRYSYSRDAAGFPRLFEYDADGDGIVDNVSTVEFERWSLMTFTRDDADGTRHVGTISYDQDGNPISEHIDWGGDGTVDEHTVWRYDEYGRRIVESFAGAADSYINTMEYDARGFLTRVGRDRDGDGVEEDSVAYLWSPRGKLLLSEHDRDGDGAADERVVFRYDRPGNLVSYELDRSGDGVPDYVLSYQYDDHNRRIRHEVDNNGDGQPYRIEISEYDGQGNLALFHQINLTATDFAEYYEHDADSNLVLSWRDVGVDGSFEDIRSYAYDGQGNLVKHTVDLDGDGALDRREEFAYDVHGNRETAVYDDDGDGIADRIVTSTFLETTWAYWLAPFRHRIEAVP